jgi:hypothetical protein
MISKTPAGKVVAVVEVVSRLVEVSGRSVELVVVSPAAPEQPPKRLNRTRMLATRRLFFMLCPLAGDLTPFFSLSLSYCERADPGMRRGATMHASSEKWIRPASLPDRKCVFVSEPVLVLASAIIRTVQVGAGRPQLA